MAVNFQTRSSTSKKFSPDYKSSLSAIENVWSNIASTKENLDDVDRKIRIAGNFGTDESDDRKGNSHQYKKGFVRKYSKPRKGRVVIDPNPQVNYKEPDEDYNYCENEGPDDYENLLKHSMYGNSKRTDQFLPKRSLHGDKYDVNNSDNIQHDFDYEPDDVLVNDRPVTPKVPRLDSSDRRRSLLENIKDSGKLQKIREKIKQQKENLASSDHEAFPTKLRHTEDDPVITLETKPREPMKRKTASSSNAPSYKGFNLPKAKDDVEQTRTIAEAQNQKLAAHKERKDRVGIVQQTTKHSQKSNFQDKKKGFKKDLKRSPGKMQRKVALQKPMPSISTTSWRAGQEAVKKVMQAMKDSRDVRKSHEKQPHSREDLSDRARSRVNKISKDDEIDVDESTDDNDITSVKDSESHGTPKSTEDKTDSTRSDGTKGDSKPSKSTERSVTPADDATEPRLDQSEEEGDLKKISKNLSKNDDLPDEAKSMLADLQMDPSDVDEEDELSKDENAPAKDVPQKKSPAVMKKFKRKAPQGKQKTADDEKATKPKVRHYDQDEIQSYMAKQLADRKKKRMQEKRRQHQLKLEQEQKLKELYMKQRTNLRASLSVRQSKLLGSTFTKQSKNDDKAKSSQDKFESDTAMKQFINEEGALLNESNNLSQGVDQMISSHSPPVGESSKREHAVDGDNDESVGDEIEEQFKDSLEFDQIERGMLGISVSVKKAGSGSPVQAKTAISDKPSKADTVKSVEDEVRDLLEKYKLTRPTVARSSSSVKVDRSEPHKMSKAERIAAINATATSLRERLAAEANRLSTLRTTVNTEKPPPASPVPVASFFPTSEFRGILPGTGNIYEQAKTNEEIMAKELAATRIQAAFRGHSIRQGLSWKLPSGKTLAASVKEARGNTDEMNEYRRQLAAQKTPAAIGSYSSAFEASSQLQPDSDRSLLSERTNTESLINEAKKPKSSRRPKFKSLQGQKVKRRDDDSLHAFLDRSTEKKGDKYSVINIFTRRFKEASKRQLDDDRPFSSPKKKGKEDTTQLNKESLFEEDYEDADFESLASTIKSEMEEEGDAEEEWDEGNTLVDDKEHQSLSKAPSHSSPKPTHSKEESDYHDSEDPEKTLTLLPEEMTQDEPSVQVKSYHSDVDNSIQSSSDVISPARSPASLTEGSVDYGKDPVMSSTMKNVPVSHSERMALNEQDSSLTTTNTVTEKFSPGTLERKLRAEVNQLETMDDALRQITDIERVRGVSLAQQETVSLAQILKARQLGYKQELNKLSKDASEQAARNAEQVSQSKKAAEKASENTAKTLAEIRAQAAETVAESTRRLEEVQREAAKRAEEATERVEKAQKMASDVVIESANRYSNDIQTMASNAASAAASSAVQAAMQIHREQLEQLRNEALKKVSKSYSQSSYSSTSSRSASTDRTISNSVDDSDRSKSVVASYADDDFEDFSGQKSSISERLKSLSNKKSTASESSVRTAEDSSTKPSFTVDRERSGKSVTENIDEAVESESESKAKESIESKEAETEIDEHSTPLKKDERIDGSIHESLQQSEIEEQSFKIDDHLASSLTEDDLDDGFRMVLPVMSHRRKSLEREKRRRGKLISDNGTSSDDGKHTPTATKHGTHSPFAGEDTFNQFTADMVKQYIQEEEIRGRHQTALLKLREKALIEKAQAEMAWLEMQKTSLKNKGADDLMPPLNKKQRGLRMKLKSEQSEIRRLEQAYRAASQERKFMLFQQKEIVRLKEETQKIWSKLGQDKAANSHKKLQESMEKFEKSVSQVSSIGSAVDQQSVISDEAVSQNSISPTILSKQQRTQSSYSKTKTSTPSKSSSTIKSVETTEVPEDIPTEQQPSTNNGSFPTYSNVSNAHKLSDVSPESQSSKPEEREETESTADEVSVTEHTKSSVATDLKRLKKKSSEQYLKKREKMLRDRRGQFESIIKNQRDMADWKKRVEIEEMRLKTDIKRALEKSSGRGRLSSMQSKPATEEPSESSESSTMKSIANSASRTSSTKSILSKEKSSESDISLVEDIKTASNETDNDIPEESIVSVSANNKGSDTSVPEEYGEDTFESPSGTKSLSKMLSTQSEAVTSSIQSSSRRKYSKDSDESKSEEEVSLADATSDASDIEKRIRQLEEELTKRRKDLDRIRKKRNKDQLRKREQKLKQELQAVESQIQQENKENLHHDRSSSESSSFIKGSVSPKIMSPKILQPASQHEQISKKQFKESPTKPIADNKEVSKREQDKADEIQGNKESDLAKIIANRVIEQVKEKTSRETTVKAPVRSLSEEVDALKKLSEKSNESSTSAQEKLKSVREGNTVAEEDKTDSVSSILSYSRGNSQEESSVSEARSAVSKPSISDRSYSKSEKFTSSKDSAALSKSRKSSAKSEIEELSLAKDASKSAHVDDSVSEDYSRHDRSDSLQSISESIFSDKSIEEEFISRKSRSQEERSVSGDVREKTEPIDNIYKDDFFESSSSAHSSKISKSFATETEQKSIRSKIKDAGVSGSVRESIEDEARSIREESGSQTESLSSKFQKSSHKDWPSQLLSQYDGFRVGDKVVVDGMLTGVVRYIGRVSFSPVAVAGIELDDPVGNTDGAFRGKHYFTCSADRGLFSPIANIAHVDIKADIEAKEVKEQDGVSDDLLDELSIGSAEKSLKAGIDRGKNHGSTSYESSLKGRKQKEVSYEDDFEDEERLSTDKEISYSDDFKDLETKEEKTSTSAKYSAMVIKNSKDSERSQEKDSPRGSISERLSIHTEISEELPSAKELSYKESVKDELRPSSPLLSELESSDAEAVPLPPRVDLNQLANSLTEGLLKKLLAESLSVTSCYKERKEQHLSYEDLHSRSSDRSEAGVQLSSISGKKQNEGENKSTEDISEEIVSGVSDKSDDTIKRMSGHISGDDLDADIEVSEAFITPAPTGKVRLDDNDISEPLFPSDITSLEKLRDDQNRRPGLVEEVTKTEGGSIVLSPEASRVTDREINNVSQKLLYEAISQMALILAEKKAKLASEADKPTGIVSSAPEKSFANVKEKSPETSGKATDEVPKTVGSPLGELPRLSTSPPETKSPTDFDLKKPSSAIDTDLLAAKLNELKRMDQEIDDLLGDDDSDDDEPFAPITSKDIPGLDTDETDLMPPVRVFDFGEPLIYVPNTLSDIGSLVSESANAVFTALDDGDDYEEISPSDEFLRRDVEKVDSDLERGSKILYKKMVFDVTKDLLKEVQEFRDFQTATKQLFSKPNRRVFPKFIRQVHNLTGEDLIGSLREHVCVCLGLKEGRPSLDALKRRLPLNTAKKDYIDAILVEELREEEPQWVNYDEDEVYVKDQLTEGILESLLTETVLVLNDIQTKRTL